MKRTVKTFPSSRFACQSIPPAEITEYLDTDLDLFKRWMADRDALASCLKKNLRTFYNSLTEDWKSFFLQEYNGHFVSEME